MDRTPPSKVQQALRREVNFGCPVQGCGQPFLTWHHFAPPWSVQEHHDPEGMIALCSNHHKMADRGVFSPEQLRKFKNRPNDIVFVQTRFEWMSKHCVIRLGGCYAPDWCAISVRGNQVLRIRRDEGGFITVSFMLRDSKDRTVAAMADNMFTVVPDLVHDLSVSASGHMITIWLKERNIGIKCRYSRKSIDEVEKTIMDDMNKAAPPGVALPEPIQDLHSFYDELAQIFDIKDLLPISFRRRDPVGTLIRWHVLQHRESDGRIPFIDIVTARLYGASQCINMREGKLQYNGPLEGGGRGSFNYAYSCQNRLAF